VSARSSSFSSAYIARRLYHAPLGPGSWIKAAGVAAGMRKTKTPGVADLSQLVEVIGILVGRW